MPPFEGLADIVSLYCVVYAAFIVHEPDGVNVELAAVWPQPDSEENTYCVLVLPDIGEAYEYVIEEP